jgi:chromosome segregation ATPase
MELEELAKRMDWLEKERRKDRGVIADLNEKITAYEGNFNAIQSRVKEFSEDLSHFSSAASRLEQFDTLVAQHRAEITKSIEDMEKRRAKHERDVDARRRLEQEGFGKSLNDMRASVDSLLELRKAVQARVDEDARLARSIAEFDQKLEDIARANEDIHRSMRSAEDGRKNDAKRLADMQGELAAIRKRAEEAREKAELNGDSLRLLDGRLNEIIASETERRQSQMAFIEQQNLAQVERDRAWKDWQVRFDTFAKQTATLDQQLTTFDETQRLLKRTQDTFEDINQRLERRINEITEIQRLAEDRFRQEWVTFKSDDQKRWTNYSLTQDEIAKNIRTELEKANLRLTALDDLAQTHQDLIQQTSETTETQLQELMNWAHEYLTSYERIMGRTRPSR